MTKPEISIIVPVHNLESFIGKSLDSILAQTFTNFEVIVVNDGSSDGSGDICDAYATKDKRINVFHIEYGGVSVARNIGVDAAQGNYIGFVDGDDYIDGKMYEMLYQYCREKSSEIAICKLGREIDGTLINRNKEDGFYTREFDHIEAIRQLFLGKLYRFSLCNKLFSKSCFEGVRFPEGRIHEDLSTTYRLFANANKAVYVNYVGYIYVKQQDSILMAAYHKNRLDAFVGWDEILSFMKHSYPELESEIGACFAYSCIDHAYYIINQLEEVKKKEEYLSFIQFYIKRHYSVIHENSTLAFRYKMTVAILRFNTRLFVTANRLKKRQFSISGS